MSEFVASSLALKEMLKVLQREGKLYRSKTFIYIKKRRATEKEQVKV